MIKEQKTERKVDVKKRKKENQLYSAAYELFVTKGENNTAIDDIVKKAGVAKGTFYLYFKDKYDIINKLILQKSSQLIKEALANTEEKMFKDFEEETLYFIDYVIEYFKENKLMLKLIKKNFTGAIYRRAIMVSDQYEEVKEIADYFIEGLRKKGMDFKEAEFTLFMILELVGSMCYSSIILEEPAPIDEVKPILFKRIIAMISIDT